MEKKKMTKMRIALITAGVLIVSTAMLVTAILFSGNAEENRIFKTAYAQDGTEKEVIEVTADDSKDQENDNAVLADIEKTTEGTILMASAVVETNEPRAVETPAPAATNVQDIKPGPEDITADEAIDITIEHIEKIFGMSIDKADLSTRFNNSGYNVKHHTWWVYNEDYGCSIDAISGELHLLDYMGEYQGKDDIKEKEFMDLDNEIRNNPEPYYEKAAEIVNANLADGRDIEYMLIDGIQVVFINGNQPQTLQVDCRVLMESGRSYSFGFTGSELFVTNFYSHPTQNAAIWGYWWEEEASRYPDWEDTKKTLTDDSYSLKFSPMPTPQPSPTPQPTSAPSSESVSE